MDSQPGQIITPRGGDQNQGAVQQAPAGAVRGVVSHPDSSGRAPTVPAASPSPAVSGQSPAPDEDHSLYSPGLPSEYSSAPSAGWQYNREAESMPFQQPLSDDLSWTASEFIEHPKGFGWYSSLALIGLVVSALNYMFTHDVVSTGVIVIAAVLFGLYAGHKPRTQQYQLSSRGLRIGDRLYMFQTFKAFSVIEEGATVSIVFTPLGRFAPPLTIYVARDMEERVLDYLGSFLPFEQHRFDAVDGLLRRIRF